MLKLKYFILCVVALVTVAVLSFIIEPKVEKVAYEKQVVLLSETDSLLVDGRWEGRQVGYVNLEKFIKLAEKTKYFDSYKKDGRDSITFKAKSSRIFFGPDDHLLSYDNLCISIGEDGKSFTAEVKEIEGVKYIYIPYHVLTSLAGVAWGN